MVAYRSASPSDADWDAFVSAHPQAHVLQLPAWGMLKGQFGWETGRVALTDGETLIAGAQLLYRPLPFRLGALAYLPKGPLAPLNWWDDPTAMRPLWDAIHTEAARHGARWLKVEAPDAPDLPSADTTYMEGGLREAGFTPSLQTIQPPRTVALDLTPDEDAIMARMKQKTRYNIRLSAKKGVTVRQGTAADVASFAAMMGITGERDAFGVHDAAYYRTAFDLFAPGGHAALFIADYEGRDLAGIMVFALGPYAWYLYGASTNKERNRMPAYGAQWAAMRWAKAQGCTVYDMWGVPDEDEDTLEAQFKDRHDGLWGVYRTKRGWGGQVVRRAPAWDYVYSRPVYTLYQQVMKRRG